MATLKLPYCEGLTDEVLSGITAAEHTAAALLDLLPYVCSALGLQGLACPAASSRQFKQECTTCAEDNVTMLLLDALPPVIVISSTSVEEAAAAVAKPQFCWSTNSAEESDNRASAMASKSGAQCGEECTVSCKYPAAAAARPIRASAPGPAACGSWCAHGVCTAAGSRQKHGGRSGGLDGGYITGNITSYL
jgi:hypothetical protein